MANLHDLRSCEAPVTRTESSHRRFSTSVCAGRHKPRLPVGRHGTAASAQTARFLPSHTAPAVGSFRKFQVAQWPSDHRRLR
jgi:hypothetical protein